MFHCIFPVFIFCLSFLSLALINLLLIPSNRILISMAFFFLFSFRSCFLSCFVFLISCYFFTVSYSFRVTIWILYVLNQLQEFLLSIIVLLNYLFHVSLDVVHQFVVSADCSWWDQGIFWWWWILASFGILRYIHTYLYIHIYIYIYILVYTNIYICFFGCLKDIFTCCHFC